MTHAFLAIAAFGVLLIVALQDYLVPSLRNETISRGLTGRYHVLLDLAFLLLAVSIFTGLRGGLGVEVFGCIAGAALIGVAATNTAWRFFDRITDGQHSLWHTRLTLLVFLSAIAMQIAGDSGARWWLTLFTFLAPALAYGYCATEHPDIEGIIVAASPAAEKLYVAGLCLWLMTW